MRIGPLNELTDEQLMKLYQNGDEAAFKVLYERHSSKIYGFIKKRIGHKEKVAEVYQEVFIKIHKSKALYNESFPVLPWIFTVTKSVLLDELRKEKNIKFVSDEVLENLPANGPQEGLGIDAVGMLGQLPDIQKQALNLRYINDKTFEQIAERLNIKPDNARQVVSRGLKRLRELLGDGGNRERKKE